MRSQGVTYTPLADKNVGKNTPPADEKYPPIGRCLCPPMTTYFQMLRQIRKRDWGNRPFG
jgi:hypothetical protein